MIIAALVTIAKKWEHPRCLSTNTCRKKMCCIYIHMGILSALTHGDPVSIHTWGSCLVTHRVKPCHVQQHGWNQKMLLPVK